MASVKWTKTPVDAKSVSYTGEALKKHWEALHKGDHESFPKDSKLQDAWRAFHANHVEKKAAAKMKGRDAMEMMDVELAVAELLDE